jgi:prepilin-type N-terminal cleavage/methylation domain-containing protein
MHRRGFTLLEITIVLIILGVLAALGFLELRAVHQKAYIAAMQTDLRTVETAEEAYYVDHHSYTTNLAVLDFNGTAGVTITIAGSNLATGYTAYASHEKLPKEVCGMWIGTDAVLSPSGVAVCTQQDANGSAPIGGSAVTPK